MWACPYGAPQYNKTAKVVEKCNMCKQRVDAGLKPSCVDTCVGRALQFGTLTENNAKDGATDDIAGMPSPKMTKPSTRYKDIS